MKITFANFLIVLILSLLLCFTIISFSFLIVVYDLDFYRYEFTKSGVYDNFSNGTYVDSIASNLIGYFYGKTDLFNIYTEKEAVHLHDVKNIINYFTILFFLSFFILVIVLSYLHHLNYKYFGFIFMFSFIFLAFILFLLIASLFLDFEYIFDGFHRLFFTGDSWILSNDSLLIGLFSEGFFFDALVRALFYAFIFS